MNGSEPLMKHRNVRYTTSELGFHHKPWIRIRDTYTAAYSMYGVKAA